MGTKVKPALWLLLGLLLQPWHSALAHDPGISTVRVMPDAAGLSLLFSINASELERFVSLDSDSNATVSEAEVEAAAERLRGLAISLVRLEPASDSRMPRAGTVALGAQQTIELAVRIDDAVVPVDTQLAFLRLDEFPPDHRLYVSLEQDGTLLDARILSARTPQLTVPAQAISTLRLLQTYITEGMQHIWSGFDHMLFLVTLLLPAVLVRTGAGWTPAEGLKPATLELLKVVTAFTLAHSITLSLSVLNILSLPSRLVESLIALSVILAALNNLWPLGRGLRWPLALGFGLLHGFGFASVLSLLGLPAGGQLAALAGFNIGIELGQLALVAILFPPLYLARSQLFFQPLVLRTGSVLVILVAGVWLWQRVFPGGS
uniref:HupE/UreJ family protein n=1 Tax=Marinobacterium profundum TaxID=1714300 RepID=UPI001C1FE8F3|nr:HupE/UreJ family protein [Marinobacterium profundum]